MRRAEATAKAGVLVLRYDGEACDERLCDLLREHKLGVRTTVRQVETSRSPTEFCSDL